MYVTCVELYDYNIDAIFFRLSVKRRPSRPPCTKVFRLVHIMFSSGFGSHACRPYLRTSRITGHWSWFVHWRLGTILPAMLWCFWWCGKYTRDELTWNLQIDSLYMPSFLQRGIFRLHVCFRECICLIIETIYFGWSPFLTVTTRNFAVLVPATDPDKISFATIIGTEGQPKVYFCSI